MCGMLCVFKARFDDFVAFAEEGVIIREFCGGDYSRLSLVGVILMVL